MMANARTADGKNSMVTTEAPKIMDKGRIAVVEADINRDQNNGNQIYALHCADELIQDLSVSARALKEAGEMGMAREQAIEAVKLIHRYDRYHINEATENLISIYYGYGSSVDQEDVNDIFELAKQMADIAKEPVHTPAISLLTEFFEHLKTNSKTAAEEEQHAYSAEQADLASTTASRIGSDYVSTREISDQATFAIEQYAKAIDQELLTEPANQDKAERDGKIAKYIGRIEKLPLSIRTNNKLLRRIVESAESLRPIIELHQSGNSK